jgi:hypothetical protein
MVGSRAAERESNVVHSSLGDQPFAFALHLVEVTSVLLRATAEVSSNEA